LGSVFAILAYIVYSDLTVQLALAVATREVPLYAFLLLFLGIFLILSGLLMLSKETLNQKVLTNNG
jgi:sulfite exporter TauE/SafE